MRSPDVHAVDRRILALAVPALFTLAAEPLYLLADTAIVGHLGTAALGGLALAGTVLTTSVGICNVLTWGTTSRVGFLRGAGDDAGVARVAATVLWVATVVGVALALLLALTGHALLVALGGHGAVLRAGTTYLRIGVLGVPAMLIALAGQGLARGEGNTVTPLGVVVGANVVNLLLELLFVYGWHFGVAGSAWGTVLAQIGAAVVFTALLLRRAGPRPRPDRAEARRLARVSVDLVVRTGALFATLVAASAVAARLGSVALAGHQVAMQLFLFLAFVLDAAAIAAQSLVATALGAGDAAGADLVIRRAGRITGEVAAVVAVALMLGRDALPALFSGDARVVAAASSVLPILAMMQAPGAIAFVLDGALMGASDFVTVKWATIAGLVVFSLPAAAVLFHPGLGLRTLWSGLGAWLTARAVVNVTGWWRARRVRLTV